MERPTPLTIRSILSLTILLLLIGSARELAAQSVVTQAPDCYRSFAFTAVGAGPTLTNYGPGSPDGGSACTIWLMAYAVQNTGGSVSSLSLSVQSAPASATSYLTPGTFVTYAGTVETGINPNVNVLGAQTTLMNGTTAIPFIRVNLTALSATGTTVVFGVLQGWSEGNSGGGGGGSGCAGLQATPCIVAGPDAGGSVPTQSPVQVAGWDGTDIRTVKTDNQGRLVPGAYPSRTAIALTTVGLTQLIPLSGSTVITIGSYSVAFASAVNFQLEYGTGSACGTGTTALTGVYQSILTVAIDDPIEVPAGQAVCANLGASVVGGGVMMYNQQ